MRVAIATVLVAFAVVLAGCPGTDGGEGGQPAAEQNEPTTIDNDAGAEPANPQNGTGAAGNGTDEGFAGLTATANATAEDGAEDGG